MKWIIAFVLSCITAAAQPFTLNDPAAVAAMRSTPGASAGAATYLVQENAEEAGTPAGWTVDGTVNWDYTTTILEGSESVALSVNAVTSDTYISISASGEIWVYFLYRHTATPAAAAKPIMQIYDATISTIVGGIVVKTDNTATVFNGTGTANATTSGTLNINTTYSVWFHWVKGTGANGVASVEFQTTPTRTGAGANYIAVTTGDATLNAGAFALFNADTTGSNINIFDHIRVDDADIGSSPP